MGAWIEICVKDAFPNGSLSRTPRWVRGLKYRLVNYRRQNHKVAPHDGCVD